MALIRAFGSFLGSMSARSVEVMDRVIITRAEVDVQLFMAFFIAIFSYSWQLQQ